MSWVEPILNDFGSIIFVRCWVYTIIERKDKVLLAKWDSIKKHVGEKKNFDGKWYMDPKCGHAKSEITYDQLSTIIVL
jgi:hypothetical protein